MPVTVLLVEDERDIADLVRYHVEKAGMRLVHAADGGAALRLARAERPDVALLDLMLPGLDGLEVCRQLRGDVATRRLPIIMLTARGEEVDRVVGLELGADDYVVKPFSPRELLAGSARCSGASRGRSHPRRGARRAISTSTRRGTPSRSAVAPWS